MSYSIENINDLPTITKVKKKLRGLALVDAILMPEWEYRYFSFNSNWDGNNSEMLASMKDGSGSEYFINFTKQGCIGKVLYKNKLHNVRETTALIPNNFSPFKNELAFNINNTTFFFWRKKSDSTWFVSPENLSKYPLLGFLTGGISSYHAWAESYYEKKIDDVTLNHIFTSLSITKKQLAILNPHIELEDLKEDIKEIL